MNVRIGLLDITLMGAMLGMIMAVPTIFLGDVIAFGLIFALVFWIIGKLVFNYLHRRQNT